MESLRATFAQERIVSGVVSASGTRQIPELVRKKFTWKVFLMQIFRSRAWISERNASFVRSEISAMLIKTSEKKRVVKMVKGAPAISS